MAASPSSVGTLVLVCVRQSSQYCPESEGEMHTQLVLMECCAERVRPSLAPRPILHFLFFSLHSYNTFSCFSISVYYTGHKPNDKISGSEARGGLGARLGGDYEGISVIHLGLKHH